MCAFYEYEDNPAFFGWRDKRAPSALFLTILRVKLRKEKNVKIEVKNGEVLMKLLNKI